MIVSSMIVLITRQSMLVLIIVYVILHINDLGWEEIYIIVADCRIL